MTPAEQEGFLNRYGDPLFPTPPDEAKIDAFIEQFGAMIIGKTPDEITKEINRRELRSMVDTYEREAGKITEVGKKAERRGKATVQELMQRALEAPVPAEEKGRLLEILQEKSERQTDKTLPELTREAVEIVAVKQAATPMSDAVRAEVYKFSNLKDLKPFQKMLAPLADAVTTVFPEFRAGVINIVLAESLDKAVKNIDKVTKLFGSNVVNDPWFKKLRDDAQTLAVQGAKPGGARTVVDDVFISLFRGPAEPTMVAYMELYRINYIQGKPTPSISQMQAASLGWGSVLRAGTNIGVGAAKNAGVKWLAAKAGLALIPGPGWASTLLAIGGSLLGKVGSWMKRLVGIKGGLVPGDKEIIAVGCGSILLIFFILPFMSQLIIDSALVGRLGVGGGAPGTGGPSVNCTQTPNDPQCKFTSCVGDCKWPASGYITQGPNTGSFCSNPAATSHDQGNAANGIDIANFGGGPVYTPRAGTVQQIVTNCANNSGRIGNTCGGGYGNYVILKTDDGYTLIFGHMESSMNVKTGQHINAGTQLGWMDQTGNSTGTHLHFGVLSGGSVLDFVPQGNPALTPEAISGCVSNTPSCKKSCPSTPVVAG